MRSFFDKISMIIISIIIILNMGTVYFANNYNKFSIISLCVVGLIALFSLTPTIIVKQNAIIIAILYTLIMIPFAIISKSGSGILLFCGFIPFFSLIGIYYYKKDLIRDFLFIYVRIVLIIGMVSLFFWVFMSCFHIIKPTGIVILKWGGIEDAVPTYHNLYFECQNYILDFFGINIGVRNCGIFSEAPMASFIYSSALLANCYLSNNRRNIIEVFLTILIITTLSTTGLIVVICYYALIFCLKKSDIAFMKIAKFFVMIIVLILAVVGIRYLLIDKLNSGSGRVRSEKINMEFDAFLSNPLFGNGYNTYTNGSSNSFTSVLADGGIVLFCFYYIPIFTSIFKYRRNKIICMILILYCSMLLITSVAYSYLNTIFILELWSDILRLKSKNTLNKEVHHIQYRKRKKITLKERTY